MSLQRDEEVTCSKCKTAVTFTVWDSVNVSLDPKQKHKILDGSFFRGTCPNCNTGLFIMYDFLYHDMDKQIMLFFSSGAESDAENESVKLPGDIFYNDTGKNYKFRSVYGYNSLKEKILIFDNGLYDVDIERLKYGLSIVYAQQYPLKSLRKLYFNKRNENSLDFYIEEDGGDGYLNRFDLELSEKLKDIVQLQNDTFKEGEDILNIDSNWIQKNLKDRT